ncbi:hypothetical protein HYW17_01305 [Candidatus Uhrbacteria bacterium]|nr:hypothetical protein [Candidatus Uhrbacteria bacterium]
MNTSTVNLVKQVDIEQIAREGRKIYEQIKGEYGPKDRGKFLAIDIDTSEVFIGNTSAEAVEEAKKKYPEKVFYVVKIGYSAAETLARLQA